MIITEMSTLKEKLCKLINDCADKNQKDIVNLTSDLFEFAAWHSTKEQPNEQNSIFPLTILRFPNL